jgi:phosphomannomutase
MVKATGACLGIAHDGDADRCVFIDGEGNYVPGDKTLAILARSIVKENGGGIVVTPVATSSVIDETVGAVGGTVERTAVGSPKVARRMIDDGGIFGGEENGGLIFVGTKGKIMAGCYGLKPMLLPKSSMDYFKEPKPVIRRVPGGGTGNIWVNAHEQDWIRACKESPENRVETSSNFQISGPFTEMVDVGVLAVRLSGPTGLHRELKWDGESMRFTNISESDMIKIVNYDEFKVIDGDPKFDRRYAEFNAKAMAEAWIKHTYHNGYSLPDMPRD